MEKDNKKENIKKEVLDLLDEVKQKIASGDISNIDELLKRLNNMSGKASELELNDYVNRILEAKEQLLGFMEKETDNQKKINSIEPLHKILNDTKIRLIKFESEYKEIDQEYKEISKRLKENPLIQKMKDLFESDQALTDMQIDNLRKEIKNLDPVQQRNLFEEFEKLEENNKKFDKHKAEFLDFEAEFEKRIKNSAHASNSITAQVQRVRLNSQKDKIEESSIERQQNSLIKNMCKNIDKLSNNEFGERLNNFKLKMESQKTQHNQTELMNQNNHIRAPQTPNNFSPNNANRGR